MLNLLLESCKHKVSFAKTKFIAQYNSYLLQLDEIDFRDSVLALGFSQEQQTVLSKFYDSKKSEITEALSNTNVELPYYYNLKWRFEVQVASRCLLHQVKPLITMDLCLETGSENKHLENSKQNLILQTDPTNLVHMTQVLEQALNESRSRHVRRIQNSFQ